ncbi:unnamed protein product [Cyclocybe aegerita]|uniref:Uncharacterized protein n=1 Tax=Cyclocybe aegerita TaxID=1973307 RepID=A0A8S0W6V2_CYCAE|nr:unnamed protein product [Cyclocybe aegerita]
MSRRKTCWDQSEGGHVFSFGLAATGSNVSAKFARPPHNAPLPVALLPPNPEDELKKTTLRPSSEPAPTFFSTHSLSPPIDAPSSLRDAGIINEQHAQYRRTRAIDMTYLQHRNAAAHRLIIARQETGLPGGVDVPDTGSGDDGDTGNDGGNGNGGGNGGGNGSPIPSPPIPDTSQPPTSSSIPVPPTSTSRPPTSSSTPPPRTTPTPTSTSRTSTSTTTSSSSSSASSSSSSSSSASSTSSSARTTTTPVAGLVNTSTTRQTSSFRSVTPTDVDSAGSTVSASAVPEATSGVSTGSIVGGVVGAIAGIALFGFLIMFFLRKWRRQRRYAARHESDFGTFRRSAFVSDKSGANTPDMAEHPGHNVAPSISSAVGTNMAGYGATGMTTATPPSQALAAANNNTSATSPLQERPKYVYGQDPTPATSGNNAAIEDDLSDHAHGVYSTQPQVQAAYNPEAYGSYAKYEDGTATGTAQAYYDQSAYAQGGYDPQTYIAQGGYAQQAYAAGYDQTGYATGYAQGGYEQQGQQQQTGYAQTTEGYQAPHPYTTQDTAASKHAAAYGGIYSCDDDDDGEDHSYSDSSGADDDYRSTNDYLGVLCQYIKTRCEPQRICHFSLDSINLYYSFYYIYPSSRYHNSPPQMTLRCVRHSHNPPTGGSSTGAIIGGVGGGIAGIAIISIIVAYVVRHLRRRRDRNAFDASQFRRSAVLLDDKNEGRPRPPSMIERKQMTTTPSAPSAAYPYSDNAANQSAPPSVYGGSERGQYAHGGAGGAHYAPVPPGAPSQMYGGGPYGGPGTMPGAYGAQYDPSAGYGAPPIPGTYGPGAYAAYGADPRFAPAGYHPQGYPHPHYGHNQYHMQYMPPPAGFPYPGGAGGMTRSESTASGPGALPNPFARSPASSPPPPSESGGSAGSQPLSEKRAMMAASASSASSSSSHAGSSSASSSRHHPSPSDPDFTAPPAYEDDGSYSESRRDVKVRPGETQPASTLGVRNGTEGSSSSAAATSGAGAAAPSTTAASSTTGANARQQTDATAGRRPTSSYTLYDQDDAYGGM